MKPLVKIGLLSLCAVALALGVIFLGPCSTSPTQPKASLNIGKTETQSSLISSSTSSSSDHATFAARSVVLWVDDSHPLSQRVARLVAESLKQLPQIEHLQSGELAKGLPDAARRPDLFIHLGLESLEWTGALSRTANVRFRGSFGSSPWQSSHYTIDSTTPPGVDFNWNGVAEVQSTFAGVRTDQYGELARGIAESFSKAISNEVKSLSAKYQPLPELPSAFYGSYEPAPEFKFLQELGARRVCSCFGLFDHNQTFWTFGTATNPGPQLTNIVQELTAAGWKIQHSEPWDLQAPRIHMRRQEATLEIFPAFPRQEFSSSPAPATNFVAKYRKPFSEAERSTALEVLFAQPVDVDTLLAFERSFSGDQCKRWLETLEKSPSSSPWAALRLSDHYLSRNDTNAAMRMVLRAKALSAVLDDPEGCASAISSLKKKISPEPELKFEVTPELCRELQFVELNNNTKFEDVRRAGQPFTAFYPGTNGLEIISIRVQPAIHGSHAYSIIQWQDRSRSKSWGGFPAGSSGLNQTITCEQEQFRVSAAPVAGRPEIKFSVQFQPPM